jgi:hypothetical protein
VTPEGDSATVHEIAYAEAVRALSEQHAVVESIRTRAGLTLSSAAVTTSFLAGQAIRGGRIGVFGWLALVAFATVAMLGLAALRPRRWEVGTLPNDAIGTSAGASSQVTPCELHEILRFDLVRAYKRNRNAAERLAILLQLASLLLSAEVVLWIVAIGIDA